MLLTNLIRSYSYKSVFLWLLQLYYAYLEGVEGWYRDGGGLGPVDNPVYTGLLS